MKIVNNFIEKLNYTVICLILLLVTVGLYHNFTGYFQLNLEIPIRDKGSDFLPIYFQIKCLIKRECFPFFGIESERLGFPFGADWNDYPMNHSLFYSIIYFLGFFTDSWARVFNIYWLLTYVLTSISFFLVSIMIGIPKRMSFILSLIYSFLPHHHYRMGHIWLASYFMVPFQIYFLYNYSRKNPPFIKENSNWSQFLVSNIYNFSILILSSWSGVYYVFFFSFLLLMISTFYTFQFKDLKYTISMIYSLIISFFGLLLDSIPTITKNLSFGSNNLGFWRHFSESETYGLKLTHLLLPHPMHRLNTLKHFTNQYNSGAPLISENHTISLGIIGVLGLIISIFYSIGFGNSKIKFFGIGNLLAIFLSTIGGIGTLIAFFLLPEIRAYNRIVVFIMCFSLLSLGLFLNLILSRSSRILTNLILIFLLLLGLFDETSDDMKFIQNIESANHERIFYSKLEEMARNNAIFQLPTVDFPDGTSYNQLGEYESLRPYLFTESPKFSYGNVLGRFPNAFLQNMSYDIENPEVFKKLQYLDFSFILLNKKGYSDGGDNISKILVKNCQSPVLVSNDNSLELYQLAKDRSIQERKDKLYIQEDYAFSYGLGILFNKDPIIGRTATLLNHTPIYLFNNSSSFKVVNISFTINNPIPNSFMLVFEDRQIIADMSNQEFNLTLNLPKGRSEFRIVSEKGNITISKFKIYKK
jgi:phosphoglycerol transferase